MQEIASCCILQGGGESCTTKMHPSDLRRRRLSAIQCLCNIVIGSHTRGGGGATTSLRLLECLLHLACMGDVFPLYEPVK